MKINFVLSILFLFTFTAIGSIQEKVIKPECIKKTTSIQSSKISFNGMRACGTCPPWVVLEITETGDSLYITKAGGTYQTNITICEYTKGAGNCIQMLAPGISCPEVIDLEE